MSGQGLHSLARPSVLDIRGHTGAIRPELRISLYTRPYCSGVMQIDHSSFRAAILLSQPSRGIVGGYTREKHHLGACHRSSRFHAGLGCGYGRKGAPAGPDVVWVLR